MLEVSLGIRVRMISIIVPTYNEIDNLHLLYSRLVNVSNIMANYKMEFIFVDDCSSDGTFDALQELAEKDDRVEIIRFSRNCGSHAAVAGGLQFCRGDAAVMIAADLQDPPEIIADLILEWEKGFRVVWAVRKNREGEHFINRAFSRLFYFLMNNLTDIRQAATGADVFLVDRKVMEAFKQSPEKNTSIYMFIAWLGFSTITIEYTKEKRHSGKSKWGLSKRLKLFFDSLISFSYVPLRMMSLIGAISFLLGMSYGTFIFFNALGGKPVEGWSSLMIVILLLGGFQMVMMGMLGEYLWRTYDETRRRPRYVIEKNTILDAMSNCGESHNTIDK